jgi:hypothetical protein
MRIIDDFCDAYARWDARSQVGDVYLTPAMQFIGGHARRGADPSQLGEYTVHDLRAELYYLIDELQLDASFLIASLVRAIEAELIETSVAFSESIPKLQQQKAYVELLFESYAGPLHRRIIQGMRETVESAWRLHGVLSEAVRPEQQRVTDWREVMAPIIDRENLERARTEQWGGPEPESEPAYE